METPLPQTPSPGIEDGVSEWEALETRECWLSPVPGCLVAHLTFPCKGVGCVWEGRTACPRPLGATARTPRPANLSCQLFRQWEEGGGKVSCSPPPVLG